MKNNHRLFKIIVLVLTSVLLISCSKSDNSFAIKSDSSAFMGQILGKPISGNGELYYDEDKGCFLKIQDGARADCEIKTKNVYSITLDCSKNKNLISIDGIVCGESIINQSDYKKICNASTLNDGYYLRKNNSFFWMNRSNQVARLGIVDSDSSLQQEGEEAYTSDNCSLQNLSKINQSKTT